SSSVNTGGESCPRTQRTQVHVLALGGRRPPGLNEIRGAVARDTREQIHFPREIFAHGLARVVYDNVTRGPVVTDQGAADASSRQDLKANADGSVDLYFARPSRRRRRTG